MLIKVNGNLLAVIFHHGVEDAIKFNGHKNRNAGRHYTTCTVKLQRFITGWKDSRNKKHDTTISFFDEVASGKSTCSLEDTFNKSIGRAVSFARAIENSTNEFIKNNSDKIIHEFCEIENIPEITDVSSKLIDQMQFNMAISAVNQSQDKLAESNSNTGTIDLGKLNTCGESRIFPSKILPENLKVDVTIHR